MVAAVDEIDRAIEENRKQQEIRVLELKNDFENRRDKARRRRWTLDEGPRTRPNWFEMVSFRERCSDRWHAFCDALTRLHRLNDPILAYDRQLATKVEVARAAMRIKWAKTNTIEEGRHGFGNDDYSKESRQRDINEKRAEVAITQEYLNNLVQMEQEIGTERLTEMHQSFTEELKKERAVFDKWFSRLSRPSYGDRLGDIQAWFRSKARPADNPPLQQQQSDSFWQRIKKKIGKLFYVAPVILIPAEVFFALPGFEFLTPDDKLAAIMGAGIYTALLALQGHAAAMFLMRGFINRVDDSDGAGSTTYRPRPLFAAFLLLVCAISMAFAGADLRGKLPDIAALTTREAKWAEDDLEVTAQAMRDINHERADAIATEKKRLATERERIDETHRSLYILSYSLEKSDKMIALWVYFALFLVSAGGVILSRDPIFEYELATVAVRERESALRRIAYAKEAERQYWRIQVYELRNQLAHRRAELGKIAPADPLALPKVNSQEGDQAATESSHKNAASNHHDFSSAHREHGSDGAHVKLVAIPPHAEDKDKSGATTNPSVETFDQFSSAWQRERLQRYTQCYGWFSWYGLDAYPDSRRRALARLPVGATNAAA